MRTRALIQGEARPHLVSTGSHARGMLRFMVVQRGGGPGIRVVTEFSPAPRGEPSVRFRPIAGIACLNDGNASTKPQYVAAVAI